MPRPPAVRPAPREADTTELPSLSAGRVAGTVGLAAVHAPVPGPAAPPGRPVPGPSAGRGRLVPGPVAGRGSRRSHAGIRAFAVGLLVTGVAIGLAAGPLGRPDADRLTVTAEASPEDSVVPGADTDRPQPLPPGGRLLGIRRDRSEVAAAQRKVRARAAEANRQAAAAASAAEERTAGADGPTGEAPPSAPVDCQSYSGNRRTGCSLLAWAGYETSQMSCLDPLWTKESGWNPHAENRSSGAYGIPQALPGEKMAKYGADWRDNPVPQIKWGLSYIKGRYKTPCGAWAFFRANGWY